MKTAQLIICVIFLTLSCNTYSFGLKTHIKIGESISSELEKDCKLKINNRSYSVTASKCSAINQYKGDFLSGVLGPDIYPDIIVGQTTTHPGVENAWQTDDWLKHIVVNAKNKREIAFASGYLVHASSDVFAHSYVNNYSGDAFELKDERAVEVRHFTLEKYIDKHISKIDFNLDELSVPGSFLRDTLIFNDQAASQYIKSGTGMHLASMHNIKRVVTELDRQLEDIEEFASEIIAKFIGEAVEISGKVIFGETQLEAVIIILESQEKILNAKKNILDQKKKLLDESIKVIEKNEIEIDVFKLQAKIKQEAIKGAESFINSSSNEVTSLQKRINNLENKLLNIPSKISQEVCNNKTRSTGCKIISLGGWNPLSKKICDTVTEKVCKTVSKINSAYTKLVNEVTQAKNNLANTQNKVISETAKIPGLIAEKESILTEKTMKEARRVALSLAKESAKSAYDFEKNIYETQFVIVQNAKKKVVEIEKEIAELRVKLIDKESIISFIKETINDANVLSFYTKNWIKGMDKAGEEYIYTGLVFSKNMIKGKSDLFGLYSDWLSCHGVVFMGVPYQAPDLACNIQTEYQKVKSKIDHLMNKILPKPLRKLKEKIDGLKSMVKNKLEKELTNAGLHLIAFVTDDTTSEFIELLANPESVTAAKLNEVFSNRNDSGGKKLLIFSKVTDLIDIDLSLTNGEVNQDKFFAYKYAQYLSKMSLLSINGINKMIRKVGGTFRFPRKYYTSGDVRFSIIFNALRSIDGNHQWAGYGLPYAHEDGQYKSNPNERKFGYSIKDSVNYGFKLFQDKKLRKHVFLKIFSKPFAGEIFKHEALNKPNYSFPTCENNPFPVTMDDKGVPILADLRCDE